MGFYNGAEFEDFERRGFFTIRRVGSEAQNIKILLAGRIDAYLSDPQTSSYTMKEILSEQDMARIKLVKTPQLAKSVSRFLLIPRHSSSTQKLMNAFNKGLKLLIDSGQCAEIIRRDFTSADSTNMGQPSCSVR